MSNTTSFSQYVADLESRMSPDELERLNLLRQDFEQRVRGLELRVRDRERVERFIDRLNDHVGAAWAIKWWDGPLDHDGPCVVVNPRNSRRGIRGRSFTILPLKGEVWGCEGLDGLGLRITDQPVWGLTEDEIIAYIEENK